MCICIYIIYIYIYIHSSTNNNNHTTTTTNNNNSNNNNISASPNALIMLRFPLRPSSTFQSCTVRIQLASYEQLEPLPLPPKPLLSARRCSVGLLSRHEEGLLLPLLPLVLLCACRVIASTKHSWGVRESLGARIQGGHRASVGSSSCPRKPPPLHRTPTQIGDKHIISW